LYLRGLSVSQPRVVPTVVATTVLAAATTFVTATPLGLVLIALKGCACSVLPGPLMPQTPTSTPNAQIKAFATV